MKGIKIIARTPAGEKAIRAVMDEGTPNEDAVKKIFDEKVLGEKPLTISITYRSRLYQVALNRAQLAELVTRGLQTKKVVPDVDFSVVWL